MNKTWADAVDETFANVGEAAKDGNDLEQLVASTMLEAAMKEINTKSLARIATALYKLAGLEEKVEENEDE